MNSTRHGIRATRAVLPHEDPEQYIAHCEKYLSSLGCSTEAETDVGLTIADLRWKLRRIEEVEARRLEAEVLARLESTDELKKLNLYENALHALTVMAEVMASCFPRSRDDLDRLLSPVQEVLATLELVEASGPAVFVGARALVDSANTLKVLSTIETDGDAYRDVVAAAQASTEQVASLIPAAREAVEALKAKIRADVPMPKDQDVALRVRYKRDIERRLDAEMKFLMQLRDRAQQVGKAAEPSSGSLGAPVPLHIRVIA